MYKAFNLNLRKSDKTDFFNVTFAQEKQFKEEIKKEWELIEKNFTGTISLLDNEQNIIDGSKLIEDWFPSSFNPDVFISHSHQDEQKAIRLACWLKKEFDLNSFIDSTVWGNSNELLKRIDDKHCINPKKRGEKTTYNYNKRNFTTSHVHMMLATALNDAIYSSECIIFLNTPSSIKMDQYKEEITTSPWIYNELKVVNILDRINPRYQPLKHSSLNEHRFSKNDIAYHIKDDLNKFIELNREDLINWKTNYIHRDSPNEHALDTLYKIKGAR